jgi:hypothetical protein
LHLLPFIQLTQASEPRLNPCAHAFFAKLTQLNIQFAIWSTLPQEQAQKQETILRSLFDGLEPLFMWDQSHKSKKSSYSGEYPGRVYLKRTKRVWKEFPSYNSSNTLIVGMFQNK